MPLRILRKKGKTVQPTTELGYPSHGETKLTLNQKILLKFITRKLNEMNEKQPFLKGKLTAIGVATYMVSQLPQIWADLQEAPAVFNNAADQSFTVLAVVAAAGTIFGAGRRLFNYFGK